MSNVYFLPIKKINRLKEFIKFCNTFDWLKEGQNIALKIHFGNKAHKNNIPPSYISDIIKILKEKKTFPFLTDTNVLYRGERDNTFKHFEIVYLNNYQSLGIPIIIIGGFKGDYEKEVDVKFSHFDKVFVAKEILEVDGIVAITHFKGHMLAGIGGSIKNIGMGCASRKGKFAMHSDISPLINIESCKGCGICAKNCPVNAISIINKKANIDKKLCIGCSQCIHVCPINAISIPWSSVTPKIFQERLVEYAASIILKYKGKFSAINYLINITVDCDCCHNPGEILVDDIGILISNDPVAIDKASVDLIKEKEGKKFGKGVDKFLAVRPNVSYQYQLNYAEKIGLGTTKYQLIEFQ